jgi:hypothetical protein
MTPYDGVVGIDEPALNQFVQSVYQALHDVALKGTVTPAHAATGRVGYRLRRRLGTADLTDVFSATTNPTNAT